MHFDREALRGIYLSLSVIDRVELTSRMRDLGCGHDTYGRVLDRDLHLVQEMMVELGHIIPFEITAMEVGATEYEEIMRADELLVRER